MKLIIKRILFYIVSFTWGGLMSIVGLLAMLFTLPFGKFGIYHGRLYKRIGKNWGGVELGCFFLCDETAPEHTLAHECGHGLQNCLWGPLLPFVVCAPSAIRYWIFNQKDYESKRNFSAILSGVILSVGMLTLLVFILTGDPWWLILPVVLVSYGLVIFYWLFYLELPKHQEKPYPKYDDAWFEGQATNWGKTYVATDKI